MNLAAAIPPWVLLATCFLMPTWSHGEEVQAPGSPPGLLGGGATFPLPLYTKWITEWTKDLPKGSAVKIDYRPVGSATGFVNLANGTYDFAATDIPIGEAELRKSQLKLLHLPMTLGAVVPIYNLKVPAGKSLRLSGETLAAIFLGKVRSWDDPLVASDNPGIDLPKRPITVVRRGDGSGITYIWTDYLSKVSPEWQKQVGVTTEPKVWPTGQAAYRNDGVAALVKKTEGAIGYVELSHALRYKLNHAAVRNPQGEYVLGDFRSVTAAAAAVRVPSDYRVSITNANGKGAYPIASYTWILVNLFMQDPHKRNAMRDFLKYAVTKGQLHSESLGFPRLPSAVSEREVLDIQSLGGGTGQSAAVTTTLKVVEAEIREAQVSATGSGNTLTLTRVMRTPRWSVQVDAVEVDPQAGRVVVRMTDTRPTGIVPMVLSPLQVPIKLPSLPPRRYIIELHTREGAAPHLPIGAVVVDAVAQTSTK